MTTVPHALDGWRKSSYSDTQTNCVEVAPAAAGWRVRDTKNRAGGTLRPSTAAWRAFTAVLRR